MTPSKIAFWLAMPELEVWQAIAVTLDLDPDEMRHSPGGWMTGGPGPYFEDRSFPNAAIKDEFNVRLRLFVATLPGRGGKKASARSPLRATRDDVLLLAQVAKWLQHLGRTPISEGLLAAMQAPPAPPAPVDPPRPPELPPPEPADTMVQAVAVDPSPGSKPRSEAAQAAREAGQRMLDANPSWTIETIAAELHRSGGTPGRGGKQLSVETIRKALAGIQPSGQCPK